MKDKNDYVDEFISTCKQSTITNECRFSCNSLAESLTELGFKTDDDKKIRYYNILDGSIFKNMERSCIVTITIDSVGGYSTTFARM